MKKNQEEEIGFDARLPLRSFQQSRSLSISLLDAYEVKESIWLDKIELDDNLDPSKDNFFDQVEMVLLNSDQEVMIGGKVFNLGRPLYNYEMSENFAASIQKVRNDEDVSNDPNITATIKSSSSCSSWRSGSDTDPYASNRIARRTLTIRSVPFWTKTKAKVEALKRKNGRLKRNRTRLGVGLQITLKGSACFGQTVRQGYKSKSRKKEDNVH